MNLSECNNIIQNNITMTRKLLLAAIMSLTMLNLPAQEESSPVTYGVRLGMDVSIPSGGSDIYQTGAGFSLGGIAQIAMPKNFYFEPGLFFSYTGMTAKNLITFDDEYYYEGAAKYYGLRVPLYFGYNFPVSQQLALSVATGPYVNFNLYARQQLSPNLSAPDPLPNRKINLFEHGWKRGDAGWGIKLSMTFAGSYYIGLSTGIAFTPLASYGNKDKKIRIHRNTIAVSLGYNF